ncbi:uncharacterized protein [Rutidosis leptorrhynchoides]|uniref:uncharacterized protein n=1 Tax=Rutidosis leptorrhynchoides TaxID=125765 RepID=UPI003A99CD53
MANQWSGPICFLGDFNSVCKEEERFRENIHPAELINFNNFILSANLIDQPLSNDEFTWEGPEGKQSRIDRILVNETWLHLFPESILIAGNPKSSDHKPIIWGKKIQDWGPKPFRFNNLWLEHNGFLEMCSQQWSSMDHVGWNAFVLMKKLWSLKGELWLWKNQHVLFFQKYHETM